MSEQYQIDERLLSRNFGDLVFVKERGSVVCAIPHLYRHDHSLRLPWGRCAFSRIKGVAKTEEQSYQNLARAIMGRSLESLVKIAPLSVFRPKANDTLTVQEGAVYETIKNDHIDHNHGDPNLLDFSRVEAWLNEEGVICLFVWPDYGDGHTHFRPARD